MPGKCGNPTKADRERFQQLQELGCIACLLDGHGYEPPDVHHILYAGQRNSHQETIPLCPWHHRGQPTANVGAKTMYREKGPSLDSHKSRFIERYGTEGQLLARTNELLARGVV